MAIAVGCSQNKGMRERVVRRPTAADGLFARAAFFFPEKWRSVGDVKHGKIHSLSGIAFFRLMELAREVFNCRGGKIFYDADTGLRFENDDKQRMLIHVDDEKAEIFTLLINAVKTRFFYQAGDGLIGHKRAGGKGRNGGQIKILGITLMRDQKPAFVNEQHRRRVGAGDKFVKRFV